MSCLYKGKRNYIKFYEMEHGVINQTKNNRNLSIQFDKNG